MTVTLNEGHGHSHCYQTIQFNGAYQHIKFERNQPVNVWMQANVKDCFF